MLLKQKHAVNVKRLRSQQSVAMNLQERLKRSFLPVNYRIEEMGPVSNA